MDSTVDSTSFEMQEYKNELETQLNIPVISNPQDYLYPREYMFDAQVHCNSKGSKIRTEQLACDLNMYLDKVGED